MNSKKGFIIYLCIILFLTNMLGYHGPGGPFFEGKLGGQLIRVFLVLLVPIVFMLSDRFPKTTLIKATTMLMFFQLLSMLGAVVIHNQTFVDSFIVTSWAFIYLMFPMMYILRVKEEPLIKLCFILGVFFTVVAAVQQFTFPVHWFGGGVDEETGEPIMRNGIIRYGITPGVWGLIMLYYSFQKYLERGKRKYLIYILIGLVSVYLSCTRQIMAASAGCLLVGLYLKGKMKVSALVGILVVGLVIYHFSDTLFSDYKEMTEDDVTNDEYVRFVGYRFFALEYNKDRPLAILIGNGISRYYASNFGDEMEMYSRDYGLNLNDIGLVGEYNMHGIIYIFVIFYVFYYIFKNRKYIDLYLQLYMLQAAVTSVMLMPFRCHVGTWGTVLVLYLIDVQIRRNKRAEKQARLERARKKNANDGAYNS